MMSLVSSSGEVADPLPAAARAPSPPAGYRGPRAVLGRRGQHIYQLRANRGPPYKERPAGQAGRVLTIALCEDGQFIPPRPSHVHHL
jgi:hypothetical protein